MHGPPKLREIVDRDGTRTVAGRRKEMMLRICDGNHSLAVPLYTVYQHVACDQILEWLIANNLTGEKFRLWLREEYANSTLLMVAHALKKITRDVTTRKMYAGKDLISR